MWNSTEPRDRIYVKGYVFLSFAKNMGTHLSNKYSQKLLDTAKKSTTDAIKTASKRAIQKTAETRGDLIGNKIAYKTTGRASPKDVSVSKKTQNNKSEADGDSLRDIPRKRYVSAKERQQILMN